MIPPYRLSSTGANVRIHIDTSLAVKEFDLAFLKSTRPASYTVVQRRPVCEIKSAASH